MTPLKGTSRPELKFDSSKAWREWLEQNHGKSEGLWIVFTKSATGKQKFSQKEALEEALCYGWIDSQMRPLDDAHFLKLFTPRRNGSTWSQRNLDLARELIAEGRMRSDVAKVIDWGQEGWEKEFDRPPQDLIEALKGNDAAWKSFQKMPPKRRRLHVHYVMDAKRDSTRKKRIDFVVQLLAKGKHLGIEYSCTESKGQEKCEILP